MPVKRKAGKTEAAAAATAVGATGATTRGKRVKAGGAVATNVDPAVTKTNNSFGLYADLKLPAIDQLSDAAVRRQFLSQYETICRHELNDKCLKFWLEHSVDTPSTSAAAATARDTKTNGSAAAASASPAGLQKGGFGGYYNCLTDSGAIYDTTKHVWLNAREVWMLSRIAIGTTDSARKAELTAAAKVGADFLLKHGRTPDHKRVYFALAEDGKPVALQRKLFSECFAVMAWVVYARASGDKSFLAAGVEMFAHILKYAKDATPLGRPQLSGSPPFSPLNIPMIILNVIYEIRGEPPHAAPDARTLYQSEAEWCIAEVLKHVKADKKIVLENVSSVDGSELFDTPDGRLLNPGHAIEAGWFLMQWNSLYPTTATVNAKAAAATAAAASTAAASGDSKAGDSGVVSTALNMIDWSFAKGWDSEFGGLYYFLDACGYDPVQLEWPMKLWWPHTEAMIAFLYAYRHTRDAKYLYDFIRVTNYTLQTFSGSKAGGWYGYADRSGRLTHQFVGGAYKGCFHVPRALFMCAELLREIAQSEASK